MNSRSPLDAPKWWVFPWWFSSHGIRSIRSKNHEINNVQASIWKNMWGNKTTHQHPCFYKKSFRPKTHQIKTSSFPHSPSQENHTIPSSSFISFGKAPSFRYISVEFFGRGPQDTSRSSIFGGRRCWQNYHKKPKRIWRDEILAKL